MSSSRSVNRLRRCCPCGTRLRAKRCWTSACVLLWLHQRRPAAFAFVRTTLLLASGLALVGFLVYPTAPPRLAGIGIAETVSNGHISLNDGLVSSLYNPYAAVPSMHIGYALVIAGSLLRYGRHPLVRALGVLYAPVVLFVVVATGNHFFVDAAAGAGVAGLAAVATAFLTREATLTRVTALPMRARSPDRIRLAPFRSGAGAPRARFTGNPVSPVPAGLVRGS